MPEVVRAVSFSGVSRLCLLLQFLLLALVVTRISRNGLDVLKSVKVLEKLRETIGMDRSRTCDHSYSRLDALITELPSLTVDPCRMG